MMAHTQSIDFDGEVNLFHFYLLRSVGKGAFGKVSDFVMPPCAVHIRTHSRSGSSSINTPKHSSRSNTSTSKNASK